jgi:hypothetical protein
VRRARPDEPCQAAGGAGPAVKLLNVLHSDSFVCWLKLRGLNIRFPGVDRIGETAELA